MKLRDYQDAAVQSIFDYFEEKKGNPVVALPTGTGKSLVIADFLKRIFSGFPNQKILILTHVKELIEQNHSKLLALWPQAPSGIYSAGLNKKDVFNPIIFAGIASIAKKDLFGKVDLILIDECHLVSKNDETLYRKFIDAQLEKNPFLKVIGLTATPWRLGQGSIIGNGIFTDLCFDMTGFEEFNWFVDNGYLCKLITKNPKNILDISQVKKTGGDFNQKDLQSTIDKKEITEKCLNEILEYGEERKSWLIFCSGVEHSIHTAELLEEKGISCRAVHSLLSSDKRREFLKDFKSGKIRAVTNNNCLTTGFDHPEIDLIAMLRPTTSSGLFVQMLGRGTRPCYSEGYDLQSAEERLAAISDNQKQNCLVLDFSGNTRRLGPINDPVLPGEKKKKGGEAPVKICVKCSCINHISARECADCGENFTFKNKLKTVADTAPIMRMEEQPVVSDFSVEYTTYTKHLKVGKPPSLKITYYCGYNVFYSFLFLESEILWVRKKAKELWEKLNASPCPSTVELALKLTNNFKNVDKVKVWINKKFPEILNYSFNNEEIPF